MKNFLILAAGRSKRFGKNKLLHKFHSGDLNSRVPAISLPSLAARFAVENGAENIYVTLSKDAVETDGEQCFHPVLEDIQEFSGQAKVRAAFQSPESYGPGAAVMEWAPHIEGPFCVLFGDNLYLPRNPLDENMAVKFVLGNRGEVAFSYQMFEPNPRCLELAAVLDGNILKEKPHSVSGGKFFCGMVVFPADFSSHAGNLRKSDRGEIELTDMINAFQGRCSFPIEEVCKDWGDLTYESDSPRIEESIGRNFHGWW